MLVIFVLLASVVSSSVIGSQTQVALFNAAAQNKNSTRTIDSIFLRLPSEKDLEQIIFSADALALSKLIQTIEIKGAQIPCEALAVYSDQVLGMIKVVLQRKTLTSNQLQVIIQGAELEIVRIRNQINRLLSERDKLNLSILRNNLEEIISKLQEKYDLFNDQVKQLPPIQAQIEGIHANIQNAQQKADQDRELITQRRIDLTEYNANIKKLQQEIVLLKQKKAQAQLQISKATERISANEKIINESRARITTLEKRIQSINNRSDILKKQYTKIEVQVERIREDINIAFEKQTNLTNTIKEYENRLLDERDKLAYRELDILNSMIKTLGNSVPRFFEQNNEIYYNCFGDGSVETVKSGSVVVYIINGARLPQYLSEAYNFNGASSINTNLRLSLSDPFGSLWKDAYGTTFLESQLQETSAFAVGDFTCLNPSQVSSGSGVIKRIKGRTIQVSGADKKNYTLNIGACSRIQAATAIPKVGQNIVYKGIFNSQANSVNLYAATCY